MVEVSNSSQSSKTEVTRSEVTRYEQLPKFLKVFCLVLFATGIGLTVFYMFSFSIRGHILESAMYYYLLYACFYVAVFLILPLRKTKKHRTRIPWYDLVIAAFVFGTFLYFASQSLTIRAMDWRPPPTVLDTLLAGILIFVSLEGVRRLAGYPIVIVCVIMGIYPIIAGYMPDLLFGKSFSWQWVVGAFAFGGQGLLGLPSMILWEMLIGFLIFAGLLVATGGGKFFINLALVLFGRHRGGPAKVAVVASGLFGSLSGSPTSNVVTTGAFTIPAMKRMGYPPHYAGAIEAVASCGGQIMPPVMGSVAFVVAVLTATPYANVMIAAFIPALLYYWGLLVQVDAYAARLGFKGLPREEIPALLKTLKEGWIFLVTLAFLVFGLVYMRWGVITPFYASGMLVVLSFTSREAMMTPRKIIATLGTTGHLVAIIASIMVPIGLVIIGLQSTGSLAALTAKIVGLGGTTNVALILLMAVPVCYLFGMIGLAMTPYVVLAVTVLPALVQATGLNLIGMHLFLIYYLLIGGITPPVATTAFVGAAVAGSPPMKTAWLASRLAIVIYFIPFFFVFNPSLLLEGSILVSIYDFALALVGIWVLCSALEGYMLWLGNLSIWARPFLFVGGLLFAYPDWRTTAIGGAISALVIVILLRGKKTAVVRSRATD